ncbi:uncharacterized [Tachysurus ichikawai]
MVKVSTFKQRSAWGPFICAVCFSPSHLIILLGISQSSQFHRFQSLAAFIYALIPATPEEGNLTDSSQQISHPRCSSPPPPPPPPPPSPAAASCINELHDMDDKNKTIKPSVNRAAGEI